MKFIHVADIHASRERLSQTLHILNTLTERCKEGDIDFILFAGDFWDSTITATKGSGFSDILEAKRELEKYTYLYFIYGTPSHEPSGSLDAFISEKTKIISENSFDIFISDDKNTDIFFIPEPRRSNCVGKSAEEINNFINSDISKFIKTRQPKRKDYNRIVVYHGEVKGAVYQNGISASSSTAISKELLQSLNADYYAFGHIHAPQEVFKNAWYSGSACPKDFGETHDGCYNLVTIENGETKVERVSFGLPIFETYKIFFGDFTKSKSDFTNKHIRLQFDCTKEERKSLNIKQLASEIKEKTHALSVKLEPNVIEGETASKSEVIKHKSIVEKMVEYAKEKDVRLPKYSKELLQDIQDNTLIKLSFPQHSFELLSLSLRGAIGIRDGQQKEDFELNFEQYEDGVVCLIGDNGRGKTTLVENCHPYPSMLSREGTLKDHFYLKDSHRILVYKDENGLYYKISILIDGKTASGKTFYFVETSKDRENWNSLPEVDGSLEMYKKWVERTFGSIDIFLRTAFFAKEQTKGTPDISATTKSERMELLSKLAGTDQLKEVSVIAREKRKGVQSAIDQIKLEIGSYAHYEDLIKENEKSIEFWSGALENKQSVVTELEKRVVDLREKNAEYQKVKAVSEANVALYEQYKKEYNKTRFEYENLEECLDDKDIFDTIEKYKKELAESEPVVSNLSKKLETLREQRDVATDKVIKLKDKKNEFMSLLASYEQGRMYLSKQTVKVSDVCPTCGAPLSEHKKEELHSIINEYKKELDDINIKTKDAMNSVQSINTELLKVDNTETLKSDIEKCNNELNVLLDKKDAYKDFIEQYDERYTERSYSELVKEVKTLKATLDDLKLKMDSISSVELIEDVSDELARVEFELKMRQNEVAELSADIKAAKKENEKNKKALETVSDKKKELCELGDKWKAYLFIEGAFSNDGIPAIELRESAPEIADITNKILADSYGNKFEVRFGSTSELKAKRKVNEDFNIIVYDTENGDEKTIDLVSSGERIWIKQALFYAFSIVQMNRTGFNFRTRLIDESDGSLDGGLRPKYLKMVTAAHKQADARISILITHSQEIKDIAQQIIEI